VNAGAEKEEEKGKEQAYAEVTEVAEKRDDNTKLTEVGTQRSQRRGTQEHRPFAAGGKQECL